MTLIRLPRPATTFPMIMLLAALASGPQAEASTTTERAPLLREGSTLVDASGTVLTSRQAGAWDVEIPGPTEGMPPHRLTLLPSVHLGELMHVLGAAGGSGAQVMLTGSVYEFAGENYLLLAHPARLIAAADSTASPPATTAPAASTPASTGPDDLPDDSTERIISDLEKGVGPIAHRPEAAFPAVAPGRLVPEGANIVRRRGQVRRTETGGYLFIFDADASGQGDPPMLLLPCRLLERIDRHLRKAPQRRSPMLLTGHVMSCRGRNYLLPTVYQIPRERTKLSPAPE